MKAVAQVTFKMVIDTSDGLPSPDAIARYLKLMARDMKVTLDLSVDDPELLERYNQRVAELLEALNTGAYL